MSKSNKKDVGKGIRALLSNIEKKDQQTKKKDGEVNQNITTNQLSINFIEPNPYQPRKEFKEEDLEELINSIKVHGIIQPIAVRKLNNKSYQIISGERRWRAAKILALDVVPVHILKANDQSMLEMALLENVQRADLNPLEIAISYQRLLDECQLTHEELSERIGKKRSSISNYLRILKLSPSVQSSLKNGQISMGHAKILAGIERIEIQTMILGRILKDDLSVRATENVIKEQTKSQKSQSKNKESSNPIIQSIIKKLSEHLGTKVNIERTTKGNGQIKIAFTNDDDFNDIIDSLLER